MNIGARTAAWAKSGGGGHWLTDFAVDSTTLGEPFACQGFSLWSDFVKIETSKRLYICWDEDKGVYPTPRTVGLCLFDKDFNYISAFRFNTTNGVRGPISLMTGAVYCRFCCVTTAREDVAYIKEEGTSGQYFFRNGKPENQDS